MKENLKYLLKFIAILYIIHLIDWILPFNFNQWGITPRTWKGLVGIVFAPFLHGSWIHLISNTVPLFLLLFLTLNFYPKKATIVISTIVILGGLLVWIFARQTTHIDASGFARQATHIGASGLVYGLAAFLVVHGFLQRDVRSLLLSLLVVGLYGGLIWGVFPTRSWISWEGHLFGALSGAFIAYRLRNKTEANDEGI